MLALQLLGSGVVFLCLKFLLDGGHAGFQGCAYGEDNED